MAEPTPARCFGEADYPGSDPQARLGVWSSRLAASPRTGSRTMNRVLHALTALPRSQVLLSALLLVALIGGAGYMAPDYSLSVLYLVPIALVAGPLGFRAAIGVSVASAAALFLVELNHSPVETAPLVPYWNAGVHLAFFGVTGGLLAALRREMEREEREARQDPGTGAANRRAFFERLEAELERARRYRAPFSLAVLDQIGRAHV